MRLWEAILEGCKLSTQCRGKLVSDDLMSTCAMGAAFVAVGAIIKGVVQTGRTMIEMFPVTGSVGRLRCPEACIELQTGGVVDVVVHLNDHHNWERERIAYWLRDIEEPNWRERIQATTEPSVLSTINIPTLVG